MSKQNAEHTDPGRREFIKTLAVAGSAVVAVAAVGEAGAEVSQAPSVAAKGSQGYRETEHVRAYYASARI